MDLFGLGKKKIAPVVEQAPKKQRQVMSTEDLLPQQSRERLENQWVKTFDKSVSPELKAQAFDNQLNIKAPQYAQGLIPDGQLAWYANQGFIGYQTCAMLSQNWLISKCCSMPAEDAVRNGYDITTNDGVEVSSEVLDDIRSLDVKFEITKNLIQFVQMGRIFGIRIAMFKVDSDDPKYYEKPFNLDGVEPGAYKGISQIDPYWITPQLSSEAAGDPSAIDFYVPTWWTIAGKLVHKSHLCVFITDEVPDILKPSYIYGGVSVPQKIIERVYAAERVANEAPLLSLTKRTDVIKTDLAQATANQVGITSRILQWVFNRDNYGVKILGLDEEMQQFDTSLADLDAVIMTQYQLVAAASNVPSARLMGTTPKGFNGTGELDEAFYHEMLKSTQIKALTPLLNRHHELLVKSYIIPKYNLDDFSVIVNWNTLDEMTGRERAELMKMSAEAGSMLIASGVISPEEERKRIINDPDSGYSGLISEEDFVDSEETETGDL